MVYNQPNMGKYNHEGEVTIASKVRKGDWILVFSRARGPSDDPRIRETGATFFATVESPPQRTKQGGNCRVIVDNITEGEYGASIAGNTMVVVTRQGV